MEYLLHSNFNLQTYKILQICRVEDLTVSGLVMGSIIDIHRARTVSIEEDGIISASELGYATFFYLIFGEENMSDLSLSINLSLAFSYQPSNFTSLIGCKEGIGKGKFLNYGAGGGAGHGGKGGSGYYNGLLVEGGQEYGDADLPCELGSGSGGSSESLDNVAGGGMIGEYFLNDIEVSTLLLNSEHHYGLYLINL